MRTAIIIVICLIVAVCLAFGIWSLVQKVRHERELAEYPVYYEELIENSASEFGLDPYLVLSIVRCESSFDSDALSDKGAFGLMQIMPDTGTWVAHKLGMDETYTQEMLADPETNIRFGCWYLSFLQRRFSGYRDAVICAYNAGHGTVEKWLSDSRYSDNGILAVVPFPQTERYLEKVNAAYGHYVSLYPDLFSGGGVEGF